MFEHIITNVARFGGSLFHVINLSFTKNPLDSLSPHIVKYRSMTEHTPREEILHIIRHLEDDPSSTQRALSNRLNISLGKTNYLLKELIKKGFVKANNFSYNSGKLQKMNYLLTKEGLEERVRLTGYFLKAKEEEYNRMKKEWEQLVNRPAQYSSSEVEKNNS